jgi:iron-sulfur cluster assembly accessory protein
MNACSETLFGDRMTAVEISAADATSVVDAAPVSLTDAAALKVRELLDAEGRSDLRLRVAVQPGGCAGMQYQLFFDERSLDGDVAIDQPITESGTVPLVLDRASAPLLVGAVISYTDTIEKQGFEIDNPNAGGGCACGNSFCG